MSLLIENANLFVFWIVVAARVLIPLTIPRYPLPGILASLLLDGVDQTIFQQFPDMHLENYQSYDKALDIYYLTIAYISTLRNWKNYAAFKVSRFLFYWRLAGVAIFELTQFRVILLIFPNTFEYFFIFYEAYRLRWNPMWISKKFLIGIAAFIWILIKLPQEYWIHIGQIDTTDWIKTKIFGLSANTSWMVILQTWLWVFIATFIIALFIMAAIWKTFRRRLPSQDRKLTFSADAHQPAFTIDQTRNAVADEAREILDAALFEKIILITLVSLSFAQVLPGVQATNLQLAFGVIFIVFLNTVLSHLLARRGFGRAFTLGQFFVLALVNGFVMLGYIFVRRMLDQTVGIANALFFVILFSLLITLFDRYRQVYLMRFRPI